MNLRFSKRPLIAAVAVLSIVVANCYAPSMAHAARHQAAPVADIVDTHEGRHATALPCHEHGQQDHGKTTGDTSPYCCAATCAATAFIFSSATLGSPSLAEPAPSARLEVFWQPLPISIDPPPRLG